MPRGTTFRFVQLRFKLKMALDATTQATDVVQDWTGDFVVEEESRGLREGETQTTQPTTERNAIDSSTQPTQARRCCTSDSGSHALTRAARFVRRRQETTTTTALDFTDDFTVERDEAKVKQDAEAFRETDPHRLSQRQRQIDFGKNTIGYQRFVEAYPVKHRRPKEVPRTPDVHKKCSKRAFDGLVRVWRRRLHEWDMPEGGDERKAQTKGGVPRDPRVPQKKESGAKRQREGTSGAPRPNRKQPREEREERERKDPSVTVPVPVPVPVPSPSRRTSVKSDCGIEVDFE